MADGETNTGSVMAVILLVFLLIAVVALIVLAIIEAPKIIDAINSAIVFVQTGIVAIEGIANSLFNEVEFLLNGAFAFITAIGEDISSVIVNGINIAINAIVSLGNTIYSTLISVFNNVKAVVLTITDSVVNFFETIVQPIIDISVEIYNAVKEAVGIVVCFISNVICCTFGGCSPPSGLNCCECNGSCPPGQSCSNGFCS